MNAQLATDPPASHPPLDTQPVFLVGAQRSGSTLLRVMLNSHPEIAFPRLREIELALQLVHDDGSHADLETIHARLQTNIRAEESHLVIDERLPLRDLLNSLLGQARAESGKRFVMATVHRDFDRIPVLWPDAKLVFLVRDPRDVVRSYIQLGWGRSPYTTLEPWVRAHRAWQDLQEQVPASLRLEVQYERLIRDAVPELSRICEFIGTEYDEAIFDYVANSSFEPPDRALTEQWRRKLSDRDIQLTELRAGDLLRHYGYPPSGLPAVDVTPGMVLAMRIRDRWHRLRSNVERFGPALFTAEWITRKLGLRRLNRRFLVRQRQRHVRSVRERESTSAPRS
jgi:LPS sulfotransferase NodH